MVRDGLLFADSISQTLLIPLWAKAEENRMPDGVLKDASAERVVAMLPPEAFSFPKKKPMLVGSAIRSRYFDDIAAKALAHGGAPVLVNLGCGLDDRFGRTDAGAGIQVNIDLPDVMTLRDRLMPSRNGRNIDWPGSLHDTDWMDHLLDLWPAGDFSFFMEGLLMYFSEEAVRRLFVELAKRFPGSALHFDACSSHMCRVVGSQEAIKRTNAAFKWGLDDVRRPESWHPRLKHEATAYYFDLYRERWGFLSLMRFVPCYGKGSMMLSYSIAEQ